MGSLYVDRKGAELRLDADAIVFFENGERIGTVPLMPLERVYLRGDVSVKSGVLGRLGQLGIGVIVLSGRRAEPSLFLPRSHNDARIRLAQTEHYLSDTRKLRHAAYFVKGKLEAQIKLCEQWAQHRADARYTVKNAQAALQVMLGHVANKPDVASLRGLEGAAAAQYFKAMAAILPPSAGFTGRNRRPPKDPANAILSLSYTMLMAEAALACHAHGFDPAIGYLHEIDFGRPALACDVAEPLRPIMDTLCWRLFAEQRLRSTHFTTEKDGACLLGKAGREIFYVEIEDALIDARKRLEAMLKALRQIIAPHVSQAKNKPEAADDE